MKLPQSVFAKFTLLEHSFVYVPLPSASLHYLLVLSVKALSYPSASHYHDVSHQALLPAPCFVQQAHNNYVWAWQSLNARKVTSVVPFKLLFINVLPVYPLGKSDVRM